MEKPKLIINGKRLDGRALDEMRPLTVKAGVLNKADGSAYVEWGKNKVLAAVYGPRECIPRHDTNPYRALVRCTYRMSPFCSMEEHGRRGPSRRGTEISKIISDVFDNVVMAECFPKTAIDVFIEILQADGGTRIAGLTAAAVALADAGIPMKDVPCGVAVGKVEGEMAVDLGKYEDNFGESDIPVAISPRTGEILLLQMDGHLTKEEVTKGLDLAIAACAKVRNIQVAALTQRFEEKAKDAPCAGPNAAECSGGTNGSPGGCEACQ